NLDMPSYRSLHCLRGLFSLVCFGAFLASGIAGDATKDGEPLPEGALMRLGSLRWRHGEPITFLALSEDGKTLVPASQDSVLRLWDRETGKEIRRFVPPEEAKGKGNPRPNTYMQGLTRAAMSRDGKLLAVVLTYSIQLWEVDTGKALRKFKCPNNGV